jgi:UDP-N-acetylmuramoyl-L-alanyl-D-glutamate--2,6-diaminopimelate ligase
MKLSRIMEIMNPVKVCNFSDVEVTGLTYDSRKVTKGTLFFAITGEHFDGHNFIQDAIDRGASSCIVEREQEVTEIPQVVVDDVRSVLSEVSAYFWEYPSDKLTVVGITGTNGKTTSSFMVKNILDKADRKTGVVGTMGFFIEDKKGKIPNTTPESLLLHKIMREMVDAQTEICIMEVSSHGIKMGRIKDVNFDVGALTNISRDHLDFHHSMDDYLNTKLDFFRKLKPESYAVINVDELEGKRFMDETDAICVTYGITGDAQVKGEIKKIDRDGLDLTLTYKDNQYAIFSPLRGKYNAYNILLAFAISEILGVSIKEIKDGIGSFGGVPGRGEKVGVGSDINCIIDYAHTPDALFHIFSCEREMTQGKLICVFGAGGNRDRGKRPEMGRVAASLCDKIIVTSDNPRDEDPQSIIEDILQGIENRQVDVEIDREKAIQLSISMAESGDTVVIAGKGHEDYQEIKGKRLHFNDRDIAEFYIERLRKKE